MGTSDNFQPQQFISCDWGSSRLRLALVEIQGTKLLAEHRADYGAKAFDQSWKQQANPQKNRLVFGQEQLSIHLLKLAEFAGASLQGLPLIVSGMASSSLGIQELPYAPSPFGLAGDQLIKQFFPASEDFSHPMFLLSGVRSGTEVMRGEEVQAIGIPDVYLSEDRLWLFPGTHSKHMQIRNGRIDTFHTYFTGELYQILRQHSTLGDGLPLENVSFSDQVEEAFTQGVHLAKQGQLLRDLFQVRSRRNELDADQRAYFLSGILIGSEILSVSAQALPIGLAASGPLGFLYQKVCEILGLSSVLVLEEEIAEKLTILGQVKVLKRLSIIPADIS